MATMVLFDGRCVWRVARDGRITSTHLHHGTIRVGWDCIKVEPRGFMQMDGKQPVVVLAMPELWRDSPKLVSIATIAAAMHELGHTVWARDRRQIASQIPYLKPDGYEIQRQYSKSPDFSAGMKRELGALRIAATARGTCVAARAAHRAVTMLRARRARFFRGNRVFDSRLESLYFGSEGFAEWMSLAYLRRQFPHVSLHRFIDNMVVDRTPWAQATGFLLMLTLDRFGVLEGGVTRDIVRAPVRTLERTLARPELADCLPLPTE